MLYRSIPQNLKGTDRKQQIVFEVPPQQPCYKL